MKKLFVTICTVASFATIATAQEIKTDAPKPSVAMQPKLTKEQKEAQLVDAFKKAELTEDQQIKARQILEDANTKSKAIKADATLAEDAKKAKLEEINKEKNDKLKEAMGEAKFKAFQQAKKAVSKEVAKPAGK